MVNIPRISSGYDFKDIYTWPWADMGNMAVCAWKIEGKQQQQQQQGLYHS